MVPKRQSYRNLKSLGEAQDIFFSRFRDLLAATESIPVRAACGRQLVHAVKAVRSVPAYNASAVDGVAVRAASTFAAFQETPASLAAGTEAVPVNTGNPLPEGMDAVVMIEKVERLPHPSGDRYEVREAVYPWQHVRKMGEDIVRGEIILPARHVVRPYDQGALLAAGVNAVEVFRKPRVLVIPTGGEVVPPEEAPDPVPPGKILEVNGQMLVSLAAECGAECVLNRPVRDDLGTIKDSILGGVASGYDVVMTIAGSSAGSEDYTPAAFAELGELLVHGVTVMPGKPTLLAAVQGRPVVGIPGYPVSAAVSFREFVRPLLFQLQGRTAPEHPVVGAVVGRKIPSKPGVEEHVRVILGRVGGKVVAMPLGGGAGMLTSLVRADGILRIPATVSGLGEGEAAPVELLTSEKDLDGRLLVLGSHDLTIDLLASAVQEATEGRVTISSSNVGSMGGLLAVGKGVAHFAGSHLLDTDTGDYNRSWIRKHLPDADVALVTLVHRHQGLITPKGNPKGIAGVCDLVRPDVSLVNRQAGSGTRILLDYELGKAGIDAAAVAGYRNEEYTHMGVAMAVTSGRADVGMGIAAAAQALDLGFIPVARERYDLVIPTPLLDDPRIVLLLDIIRSDAFKAQVLALGGYEVGETGKIQLT
ncbi:MAG: molybdopterin biosynthesis protein [Acidobacteriota bacterium]|jgi:putative molybdopterin biosynthesis protein|nr:molybdopterin biosynthesis protein [Acidobacteriota bacterium]